MVTSSKPGGANYPHLRDDCFVPKDAKYVDLAAVIAGKRGISDTVANH